MKLDAIEADVFFKEYLKKPFQHDNQESTLEEWLEHNADVIMEDHSLLILDTMMK